MTGKDIEYRLTADPLNLEKGFKSAEDSARAFERELARLEAQEKRVHDAMTTVGTVAVGAGAAIAAGLGVAAKAAIDWESAWTGVAKVVSGTPEEMAALETQIRGLAQVLPVAHDEIAAVAAAAGQLGVRREDIAEFTKTMVMMGTATDLASDEAATALARMMNIMQTSTSDVDRLGSSVVALGNNFATTESEIVSMALRISGAGHTIGLTEADVLGFAAALSSVGIEAEAGGTAISTAFVKIEQAVRGGGDGLTAFARVAGMTADEFATAYRDDAAAAITSFVEGLSRIQQSGGDTFATLENLGLSEIRMRDAMLRLAGAGDVLRSSLDTASEGWDANTALLQEAERRYDTAEAKVQLARNAINDFAIDIGQTLLPAVADAAQWVTALGQTWAALPGPMKTVLTILALVTSAVALLSGTMLVGVPMLARYRAALETVTAAEGRLATATRVTNTAMSRLAGPIGAVIAVVGLATAAWADHNKKQLETQNQIEQLMGTLDEQTGAVTQDTRAWVAHELASRGAIDAFDKAGIGAAALTQAIVEGSDAQEQATIIAREMGVSQEEAMARIRAAGGDAVIAMVSLGAETAAAKDRFTETAEAATGTGDAMDRLDPKTRDLAQGLGLTAAAGKALAKQLSELDDEMKAVFDRVFGLTNAEDDLQDAVDVLTDGIRRQRQANDEGAGAFVGNSKAARENRDALQGVLEAQAALVLQTIEQTGSTEDAYQAMDDFKTMMGKVADQLGIDVTQVDGYNEAVDAIERRVEVKFGADTRAAKAAVEDYIRKLKQVPARIITQFEGRPTRSSGPVGYAAGGPIGGPPGIDNVWIRATPGEYMVTANAARQNRAVLDAINAGVRMPISGGAGSPGGGYGGYVDRSITINARTADFGPADLQLVMAQQEARERAGRAR